jgi:hypothetical protein
MALSSSLMLFSAVLLLNFGELVFLLHQPENFWHLSRIDHANKSFGALSQVLPLLQGQVGQDVDVPELARIAQALIEEAVPSEL